MQHSFKIKRLVSGVLVFALLLLSGCASGDVQPSPTASGNVGSLISQGNIALSGQPADVDLNKNADTRNNYVLDLTLDTDNKTVTGKQTVSYINNADISLNEVCFHLYPNAFRDKDKVPVESDKMTTAYPNGFSSGYITLNTLKAGDKDAKYTITGEDATVLKISLAEPLKKGDRITFEFEYTITLPNYLGRFGYGDKSFNLCNFYPIACVYDEKGFNVDPYYAIGDPFYSDVADYNVTLTVPKDFAVATTGQVKKEEKSNKTKTLTIEADAVRDYAAVASEEFKRIERKVGDTVVYSYYYESTDDELGELALKVGAQSIELYEKLFGDYPYSTFSVIQTDFYIGGMEYPNVVLIDKSLYDDSGSYAELLLKYVIAHETAHQWWYAMVGNNEVTEPWLDEALTDFSTQLYFSYYETEKYASAVYNAQVEFPYTYYTAYLNEVLSNVDNDTKHMGKKYVDMPTYWYYDNTIYSILVYSKGVKVMEAIREDMGDQVFFDALRNYFSEHVLENVTKDDLIDAFSKASGKNMSTFINDILRGDLPGENSDTSMLLELVA